LLFSFARDPASPGASLGCCITGFPDAGMGRRRASDDGSSRGQGQWRAD
jgi:hypothetical protein